MCHNRRRTVEPAHVRAGGLHRGVTHLRLVDYALSGVPRVSRRRMGPGGAGIPRVSAVALPRSLRWRRSLNDVGVSRLRWHGLIRRAQEGGRHDQIRERDVVLPGVHIPVVQAALYHQTRERHLHDM
jgi:hypothetical protein